MRAWWRSVWCGAVLIAAASAPAQPTQPATAPATQTAPYVATVPVGFVRLTGKGLVGPRVVFCSKTDAKWVQTALLPEGPTTRPTTMPADLLAQLQAKRQPFVARIAADLALTPAQAADEMDHHILPFAQRMQSMQVSVIFLVVSLEELRQITRDGWQNRQFDFNHVAGEPVFLGARLDLAVDRQSDDTIYPVLFDAKFDTPSLAKEINAHIRQDESAIAASMSVRGMSSMQVQLSEVLQREAADALHATPDQQWFYIGLVGNLPTRWMAFLTGGDPDSLLYGLEAPNPKNPVRAAGLDLLHPMALSSIQPAGLPLYEDAVRRRSTWIVDQWIRKAGLDGVHKTMAALRANPPTDGPALVKTIKDTTSFDAAPMLAPQE